MFSTVVACGASTTSPVVALGGADADIAVALGVQPVAMTGYFNATGSWQEQTMIVGRALGRAQQAQRVMSEVEAKIKQASLESYPVFRAAPAVRSGHYLPVSVDGISALGLPSVLFIPYGLDQLEPCLSKALS